MNNWDIEIAAELAKIEAEGRAKEFHYRQKANTAISAYEKEFDGIYRLDKTDYAICTAAGTLGGILDALFVGVPHPGKEGVEGGTIDGIVRKWFNDHFPPERVSQLENSEKSKVPYDAQDNRNTEVYVDGLSAYYHRLLSLGHDPFLGFFVGVYDILNGTMTTISKSGKLTSQHMPVYANRVSVQILEAIVKQWTHFESDVNTSMGLPVPLMGLFNLLQFGNIGKEGLSIAEVVQGMFYEGYDFQHFCAMSIPVMFTEIIVRAAWWIRMKMHGHSLLKTTPLWTSRNRTPKLDTMLFIAHSCFSAVNAIKVGVTKDPCAVNYSEWLRFSCLLVKEIKWQAIDKSTTKLAYVTKRITEDN